MKSVRQTGRHVRFLGATGGLALGVLLLTGPAVAGEEPAEIIVGTGTGIPGGTAAIPITLANDTTDSIAADVDIQFPTNLVDFLLPVDGNCVIAERLASTHEVNGDLNPAGDTVRVAIFDPNSPSDTLGNGLLATCNFHILDGAPTGTAALTITFVDLRDREGFPPVVGNDANAAIVIAEATNTPTATSTPPATATNTAGGTATNTMAPTPTATVSVVVPTNTATATSGTPTATATATNTSGPSGTPTSTRTVGTGTPTSTRTGTPGTPTATPTGGTRTPTAQVSFEDDGCNVVPTGQSSSGGMLALLLAPALLVWARRKRF